jgi:hypothetical protein
MRALALVLVVGLVGACVTARPGLDEAIAESMRGNRGLDGTFFVGDRLDPRVVQKSRALAEETWRQLAFPGAKLVDIVFAGSLADYTYEHDSDVDIHLVLDTSEARAKNDPKVLGAYMAAVNNDLHEPNGVRFLGREVQLTLTDSVDELGGIYSVLHDDWVRHPVHEPLSFTAAELRGFAEDFLRQRDALVHAYHAAPMTFDCRRFLGLHGDLRAVRKRALEQGGGVTTLGNMGYRLVRHLGWFDELDRLQNECLDRQHSL